MFSLPHEVQLDVLKCLEFNQLFSVKQTNVYFSNLINKYEGELARKKFHELSLINEIPNLNLDNIIEPQFGDFEFILDDQLKEKWQEAIDKSIPLFLSNFESVRKLVSIEKTFTYLSDKQAPYLINLPNIPKNIEEMIIVRCWLEQLFNCAFERACFYKSVFNPEMIKILFDNDKTIPAQFNIQKLFLFPSNKTFENILDFSLNHLSISEFLSINLDDVDITEKYTNILFNILINEGNKLPKIHFSNSKLTKLYESIIEYITTSRDCSKMLSDITFNFSTPPNFKLSERAEKVEIKQLEKKTYTKYQIANIYNPKVKFEFCNEVWKDGTIFSFITK
uniref:F-box domain-containing protein n=1 Tax=Meloidogyne enterolobii TaxID=390850 RepID=A0A6V7WVA3_MELEN|nr:unnamed protein product [Meloidogyne enterolobii]